MIYDDNGVTVIHWQRSHAKDGASAYRLDWNGLCFVWTGDGRPSKLDEKYAKGCDVYVTELQTELVEISSGVQGVPPFLAPLHHRHAPHAGLRRRLPGQQGAAPHVHDHPHATSTRTATKRQWPRSASTGRGPSTSAPPTGSSST